MNKITQEPAEERIVESEKECASRNQAMKPEQKTVAWVKYIVNQFRKPLPVVTDPCDGTLATEKPCVMLPIHF